MKTYSIPCVMAVWVLTTAASYGQNNALRPGSAEAERALHEFKEGSTSSRLTMRKGYLADNPRDWFVGDIGELGQGAKIVQIISKDRMLIQVDAPRDRYQRIVMLSGLPTEKWTDGGVLSLDQPVEITKTITYNTASGSNTVLLLECNSKRIKEIKAKLEADQEAQQKAAIERANAEKERKAAFEAAKWRTWTIHDGAKVEAKYGGLINSTVILTKRDGSKLKVPLADLSAEDREWIAKRYK